MPDDERRGRGGGREIGERQRGREGDREMGRDRESENIIKTRTDLKEKKIQVVLHSKYN